jgi:hypothetical protein
MLTRGNGRAWVAGLAAVSLAAGAVACGGSDDGGSDTAADRSTVPATKKAAGGGPGAAARDDSPGGNGAGGARDDDRPGTPAPSRETDRGAATAAGDPGATVLRMYRAYAKGDGRAICETQAASTPRCDEGGAGFVGIASRSGAFDELRRAEVVGVDVDGRRAVVDVRVGKRTVDVRVVRRGDSWRVLPDRDAPRRAGPLGRLPKGLSSGG